MNTLYQLYFEELLAEFDQYVLEHPNFARDIPHDAQIVFVDKERPNFSRWSVQTFSDSSPTDDIPNRSVIYVGINELVPRRSRLKSPQLIKKAPSYAFA
ncbi:MAG: hypothetical protein DRI32_07520 [Chloroflexi bacterium]|nr:MAG: hypothetical protein DRI32_07520 [Chloroflexota bacterium]